MSAQRFVAEYKNPKARSIGSKVGGMFPVSKNTFRENKDETDVSIMENSLLINGLYEKLGIEVPDLHDDAVQLVGLHREKKVVDKKVEVFETREARYQEGSILEKTRRLLAGAPVDPRGKEENQPVFNITLPKEILGAQPIQDSRIEELEQQFNAQKVQMDEVLTTFHDFAEIMKAQFDAKQVVVEEKKEEVNA